MKILFCDADKRAIDFFKGFKWPKGVSAAFISASVQDMTPSEFEKHADAEAVSIFVYSRMTAGILAKFKKLRLVNTRSTGYDNVDLGYCKKHKIKVANVAGYGGIAVAEYALGLLLNLARKISRSNRNLRRGIVDVPGDTGTDLCGKTVGVIGTGAIGGHFAKLCRSLGCDVIAYDIYRNLDLSKDGTLKYASLDTIYRKSDAISLHCNATPENHHMLDAAAFSKMKDGVIIINTARGELVDTPALYNALASKKVAGAGLDVLEHENILIKGDGALDFQKDREGALYSLVNKVIIDMPNVIITPHIAFNSQEAEHRILAIAADTIFDFTVGKPIRSVA